MQKCMLHLEQSLPIAVMVEWSGSRYKCGGQVLCSALGIDTGSVYCISVLWVVSCNLYAGLCTWGEGGSWSSYKLPSRLYRWDAKCTFLLGRCVDWFLFPDSVCPPQVWTPTPPLQPYAPRQMLTNPSGIGYNSHSVVQSQGVYSMCACVRARMCVYVRAYMCMWVCVISSGWRCTGH